MAKSIRKFIPSKQQAAVFAWVKSGKGNAFVQAVAGAGKTTTIVEAAKLMKGSVLLVAFNNKIKDELVKKIAEHGITHATARTFHSIGFEAWKAFTGKKFIKVDGYKISNLMQHQFRNIEREYHAFIRNLIDKAKQMGIGCTEAIGPHMAIDNLENWYEIIERHGLSADIPDKPEFTVEKGISYAIEVLKESNKNWNLIDFNDQIYLPLYNNCKFPVQFDWILVDESQDTNEVRRIMARKLMKDHTRMIWVGDVHQAIYGFTGADADAVAKIISEFSCTELPLTVTYRCPKAVVSAAQAYVSHIEAHESAPQGEVKQMDRADFDKLATFTPIQDAILCRKNAPLIEAAYRLIRLGIPCQIEGRKDLGKLILTILEKWKRVKTLDAFLAKLQDAEDKEVAKHTTALGNIKKDKEAHIEALKDRNDTIRALCEGCKDMQCVRDKIESMFGDLEDNKEAPKRVILSTVHKSKGREWNNVYILGFTEYMPSKMAKQDWQKDQENNLIYVGMTRAQKSLTLVG